MNAGKFCSLVIAVLVTLGGKTFSWSAEEQGSWTDLESPGSYPQIEIQHPIQDAVLPRNLPSPLLILKTTLSGNIRWVAGFKAGDQKWLFDKIQTPWRCGETEWHKIREAAHGKRVDLILAGFAANGSPRVQTRSSVSFLISEDALNAPLFYREVNLPFAEAVKDPSRIRRRFGGVDSLTGPPVVLSNLPVCGNCHSFSGDGQHLAMDIDYANSKAAYIITKTAPEMRLATSDIITWNEFKKDDGQRTFGLLSQISPNGRFVVSSVKDRSAFVPRLDLGFSQLYFPLRGILAVYDQQEKCFFSCRARTIHSMYRAIPSGARTARRWYSRALAPRNWRSPRMPAGSC